MTKTITKHEQQQLIVIRDLAQLTQQLLTNLEVSACSITGEEPGQNSHTSDLIFNDASVDDLLARKVIEVKADG